MSRAHHAARPHKVYHAGKRHMELIASVSRSSGLEKDGDALRNYKVQEEYRTFIEDKLQDYWKQFGSIGTGDGNTIANVRQREDVEGNILILFRKLREGLLSTKRNDLFALEAYETSLYLSIIFHSPAQTTSVITHLLPRLYLSFPEVPATARTASLLSLLHFLDSGYPSQSRFYDHKATLPSTFLPKSSEQSQWIAALARSLRTRNYTRLHTLTENTTLLGLLPASKDGVTVSSSNLQRSHNNSRTIHRDLARDALFSLINSIRTKAKNTTWLVLRSAYRELHCDVMMDNASGVPATRTWLCRSLCLPLVNLHSPDDAALTSRVNEWLQEKQVAGEVRPKEGVENRWIVCKVKP